MKKRSIQARRITVRLKAEETRALETAAGEAGMNVAAWARSALSQAAREDRQAAELEALRGELAALRAAALDRDYFITVAQHLDKKINALLAHLKIQMPGE